MKIDIQDEVRSIIVKGEISEKVQNPWARAFLQYIQKNPKASLEKIGTDLFGDDGVARRRTVENILQYFQNNGLLKMEGGLRSLTAEGLEVLANGALWRASKGSFLLIVYDLDDSNRLILGLKSVPDDWFDNGTQELEELESPDEVNWISSADVRIERDKLAKEVRPTYVEYDLDVDFNPVAKTIEISGKSAKKSFPEILAKFELSDFAVQNLWERYDEKA